MLQNALAKLLHCICFLQDCRWLLARRVSGHTHIRQEAAVGSEGSAAWQQARHGQAHVRCVKVLSKYCGICLRVCSDLSCQSRQKMASGCWLAKGACLIYERYAEQGTLHDLCMLDSMIALRWLQESRQKAPRGAWWRCWKDSQPRRLHQQTGSAAAQVR